MADTKVPWQQVKPGLPGYKELDKAGVWYTDENVIEVGDLVQIRLIEKHSEIYYKNQKE